MIGDFPIIKSEHIKKAEKVLPIIKKIYKKKIVISIGGESGVGKTEVATILQRLLWEKYKIKAKQLHLDDYYHTSWIDRNKTRKENGLDSVGVTEIDWKKLKKIIKRFKSNNRKLYVQRIHKFTNSFEYVIANNNNIDVLLIEGLYANYLTEKNLGIYLEGTMEDTYTFRKERMKEDPDVPFRKVILIREAKETKKTKSQADIVITWEGELK